MNRPKGTKDYFGDEIVLRDYIKNALQVISQLNNFSKIDTPIFESKKVYTRSVGETSDIVTKEMYEFFDKKNREFVLRPEGTAGTMRAVVENRLYSQGLPIKLFYLGSMFRYERPQKGRLRQFTQYGAEILGDKNPYLDCEIILLGQTILDAFNIKSKLLINSLGDEETRNEYSEALKKYFSKFKNDLTNDSLKRLEKNPLRILDDKIESKKDFVQNAPKISAYYSKESKEYFDKITNFLDKIGVQYEISNSLVRGLDYYSDTSFEFISNSGKSGSQSTLIGGGRYSNLIEEFGGPSISGIGFGLGIERIVNELNKEEVLSENKTNIIVYIMNISNTTTESALGILHMIRKSGYSADWNSKPLSIQKAFRLSEKQNPSIHVIVGPKELEKNNVSVKYNGKQEVVKLDNLINFIDGCMEEINEENK